MECLDGLIFGFHVIEPDYDTVELVLKKGKETHQVYQMLRKHRHIMRECTHGGDWDKGKFVVDFGDGKIRRLIVWTKFRTSNRLTCEVFAKGTDRSFMCPNYTKAQMLEMRALKKFALAGEVPMLYKDTKELLKRCTHITRLGWTPTMDLRIILQQFSNKYMFDDYYKRFVELVIDREKCMVLMLGFSRDVSETIIKFLYYCL